MNQTVKNTSLRYEISAIFNSVIHHSIIPILDSALELFDELQDKIVSESGLCNQSSKGSGIFELEVYCKTSGIGKWKGVASDSMTVVKNFATPVYTYLKEKTGEENLHTIKQFFERIIKFFDKQMPEIFGKLNNKVQGLKNRRLVSIINRIMNFIAQSVHFIKKTLKKIISVAAKHKSKLVGVGKVLNKLFVFFAGINLVVEIARKNISGTLDAIFGIILIFLAVKFAVIAAIISLIILIVDAIVKHFFNVSLVQLLLISSLEKINESILDLKHFFIQLPKGLDAILKGLDFLLDILTRFYYLIESLINHISDIIDELFTEILKKKVDDLFDYTDSLLDKAAESAFDHFSERMIKSINLTL